MHKVNSIQQLLAKQAKQVAEAAAAASAPLAAGSTPAAPSVVSVSHTAPFDISMNMDRLASNAAVVFDRLDAFVQYPTNAGAGGGPAHAGQQDGSDSTAASAHARLSQRSRGDFATVYGGKDGWVYNNLPPSPFAAEECTTSSVWQLT